MGTLSICSQIIVQNWSIILDIILPINESRPRNIQFETEYFVDEEKYFFLILLHMNATLCTGMIGMLAIGTMLIAYLQHTCGMFRIASYRLERATKINVLKDNSFMEKNMIHDIICAVDIHRQAMKLSKLLVSRFETMLFCLIAVGVVSLSLNLFRIFHILSSKLYIMEIFTHLEYASAIVIYMFSSNYVGQDVIDHNNHVYTTA
nr:PREDICTED: uncharacterized protein LOC105675663 [Linepithema humile]